MLDVQIDDCSLDFISTFLEGNFQIYFFLDELTLMLTAIRNPIYLLCLILFDINVLFLVPSDINVEQFFGSYFRWLQQTA